MLFLENFKKIVGMKFPNKLLCTTVGSVLKVLIQMKTYFRVSSYLSPFLLIPPFVGYYLPYG